jgi:hypothetical protein
VFDFGRVGARHGRPDRGPVRRAPPIERLDGADDRHREGGDELGPRSPAPATPDNGSTGHADDVGLAPDGALRLLAELAHRGGRRLPPTYADRLRECAATITTIGLERRGHAPADLARACGTENLLINAWIDAQIRLMVAADNH